ncbi:MAG: hypothetical protein Q8Q60_00855 [Candidatus Chromulinivorax sp.]|nr:hypothetical protein [Candidatus Chromulinivorax sp.]
MNRQNIIKIIMCILIISIVIFIAQQYRNHGQSEQDNVKIQSSSSCSSSNCCTSCANGLKTEGATCENCTNTSALSCSCNS